MTKQRLFRLLGAAFAAVLLGAFAAYRHTAHTAAPYLYDNIADSPRHRTLLLLGTAPTLADGSRNLYFDHRIATAAALYHAGKADCIIASGNRYAGYDEPAAMKSALIAQGIPAQQIVEDGGGARTIDSVLRARTVFGQNAYLLVSQKFHNERAVFLARRYGIRADAFNAADVERYAGLKTHIREYGARLRMLSDLWLHTPAAPEKSRNICPPRPNGV